MTCNGKCTAIAILIAVILSGCKTQPVGVSADQSARFRQQGIAVGHIKGATDVTVHSKATAIAGTALGIVAGSAMASNPTSVSPQGIQDAQQAGAITGGLVTTVVNGIGNNVQQSQTPVLVMADVLRHSFERLAPESGAAYTVDIEQVQWLLDYDSMFGSNNYRLHWIVNTKVRDRHDDVITVSTCRGGGDDARALSAWKADNYAQVKQAARDVGTECAQQLLGDLGLH